MAFEFIDNSTIDRAARKRIRSHAATGKNLGRKIVRPSRKKVVESRPALFRPLKKRLEIAAKHDDSHDEDVIEIQRQIGDGLSFPVPLSSESRDIVRKAFYFISGNRQSPELNNALEPIDVSSSIWVRYMLIDEAYFHCTVATSIVIFNSAESRQRQTKESIHHLSETFRLVNEQISRGGAVSDKTMAAVIGMAQYERAQSQYGRGLVHLRGLKQMTMMRGGIRQLNKQRPDVTKKVFRADLEYSMYLGSDTLFSVDDITSGNCAAYILAGSPNETYDREILTEDIPIAFRELRPDLQTLLADIKYLSLLLNDANAGRRPRLDSSRFHETVMLLGYRLVAVNTTSEARSMGCLDSLVHITLMAYIVRLLVGLDRKSADNPLLSSVARLSAVKDEHLKSGNGEALLWMLFTGRVSVFKGEDDVWLVPRAREIAASLGLRTWNDVRQVLTKFAWVEMLHDKIGCTIWVKMACKAGMIEDKVY
ncbi:hypothetical protein G7046_g5263 [Stylonectria norvegica]|nr:hypothetical protein G7046_g5263 [Stylonectria norvegica]